MNTAHAKGNALNKIGIPSHMLWGYIGVVIETDLSKDGCLLFLLITVSVCSNLLRCLRCMALLSRFRLGYQRLGGQERR